MKFDYDIFYFALATIQFRYDYIFNAMCAIEAANIIILPLKKKGLLFYSQFLKNIDAIRRGMS